MIQVKLMCLICFADILSGPIFAHPFIYEISSSEVASDEEAPAEDIDYSRKKEARMGPVPGPCCRTDA